MNESDRRSLFREVIENVVSKVYLYNKTLEKEASVPYDSVQFLTLWSISSNLLGIIFGYEDFILFLFLSLVMVAISNASLINKAQSNAPREGTSLLEDPERHAKFMYWHVCDKKPINLSYLKDREDDEIMHGLVDLEEGEGNKDREKLMGELSGKLLSVLLTHTKIGS